MRQTTIFDYLLNLPKQMQNNRLLLAELDN
jgi:hypothetical protein